MLKKNHISLAVVGLVLISLWVGSRMFTSPPATESDNSMAVPDTAIHILKPDSAHSNVKSKIPYQTLVRWDEAERNTRLKRLPLKVENGTVALNISLVLKGTCFPGDANAIEMDLKAAPNHKLMATLESLSAGGPSYSWDIPPEFLKERTATKTFTIPLSDRPSQYGFFICTADSTDKSCRDKTTRDVNEIFAEHLRKDAGAGQELRNIFFQYLLLGETGLVTFADARNDDKKFELLKKYVQDRDVDGKNPKADVDAAQKKMKTLQSFPFSFDGKNIKIELPQYDEKTCG